jgi:hypothetical protein
MGYLYVPNLKNEKRKAGATFKEKREGELDRTLSFLFISSLEIGLWV